MDPFPTRFTHRASSGVPRSSHTTPSSPPREQAPTSDPITKHPTGDPTARRNQQHGSSPAGGLASGLPLQRAASPNTRSPNTITPSTVEASPSPPTLDNDSQLV
ncbi:hypothetical protein Acsp05_34170 [Actinokineospora sp. NBRC 105648]|nr:hypothetical protein Acsp05_34170 [Actinokineospora sp. NBRC 105648]